MALRSSASSSLGWSTELIMVEQCQPDIAPCGLHSDVPPLNASFPINTSPVPPPNSGAPPPPPYAIKVRDLSYEKCFLHEYLSYESFFTRKFPDLWYIIVMHTCT